MFVNDSQKISKDKMRMWSTNMSKPEKPPENAFNYQTKRSWTPKVIKVSLFPSIDCPTGSKDQLPNSSSSSGEKETKRCLHLVSWTYSTPFCNIKSILWGSLTTSAAGISLTINKQKMMKTAKKENTGEHNDCAQKWREKVANCRGSGCQRHHQHNSVRDHQNYRDHYLGDRGAGAGQGKYNTTAKGCAPWGGACSWLCLIDQIIIINMIRI